MDNGWALVVLIGSGILCNILWRLGEHFVSGAAVPRKHQNWIEELRDILAKLVDNDIDRHNLQARLAGLVGHQPPEYDQLAQEAFARTLLLNPALAAKAEEVGLYPEGTFARMGVPVYQTYDPTQHTAQPLLPGALQSPLAHPPGNQPLKLVEPPETRLVGTVELPKENTGA